MIQGSLTPRQRRFGALLALVLLVASIGWLVFAPRAIDSDYSVTANTLSEAATQGLEGAWMTRLGFLLFGFAGILAAVVSQERWGLWGSLIHRLFGVLLIGSAVFSGRSWDPTEPYDRTEHLIHSALVSGVSVAFTIGVLIVMLRRGPHARWGRLFDGAAIVAVSLFPMVMVNLSDLDGLVQRTWFGVAYLWFGVEMAGLVLAPTRAVRVADRSDRHEEWRPGRRSRRRDEPFIAAATASEQSVGRLDPIGLLESGADDELDIRSERVPAGFDLSEPEPGTDLDEADPTIEADRADADADADDPIDLDADDEFGSGDPVESRSAAATAAITGDLEPAGASKEGRSKRGRGGRSGRGRGRKQGRSSRGSKQG